MRTALAPPRGGIDQRTTPGPGFSGFHGFSGFSNSHPRRCDFSEIDTPTYETAPYRRISRCGCAPPVPRDAERTCPRAEYCEKSARLALNSIVYAGLRPPTRLTSPHTRPPCHKRGRAPTRPAARVRPFRGRAERARREHATGREAPATSEWRRQLTDAVHGARVRRVRVRALVRVVPGVL